MAVLDFPEVNPDTGTSLSLLSNTTSFTSDLNNATQTGKLVGDQWSVNMPFTNRSEREGRRIKAFLARLGGMAGRFRMGPPDLNQLGTMQGDGVIDGAGQTGSTINTKGWLAEQDELFVEGDYLEVNGELKMVTDAVDATGGEYIDHDGTNLMANPFDPENWTGSGDADGTTINIIGQNPSGESFYGVVEQVVDGGAHEYPITRVDAIDGVDVVRGEVVLSSILVKNTDYEGAIRYIHRGDVSGNIGITNIRISDGSVVSSSGIASVSRVSTAGDDWRILEIKSEALVAEKISCALINWNADTNAVPSAGSKIYAQAAFFGKNPIEYPYSLYNEFDDNTELAEWFAGNCTTSISGGLLNMVATTGDPYVLRDAARGLTPFDGSKYTDVAIKWRRNAGPTNNQFSYVSDSGLSAWIDFSELNPDSRAVTTGPDGDGFYTTILKLGGELGWIADGNIKGFRIDAGNNISTNFDIAYAKVYSPSLLQDYKDFWPASYLAKASISIAPPLRKATNDLDPVEVVNPQAIFMLADDNQAAWDLQANYIHGATIECIEDVT